MADRYLKNVSQVARGIWVADEHGRMEKIDIAPGSAVRLNEEQVASCEKSIGIFVADGILQWATGDEPSAPTPEQANEPVRGEPASAPAGTMTIGSVAGAWSGKLAGIGIDSIEMLAAAEESDLQEIEGIGPQTSRTLIQRAQAALEIQNSDGGVAETSDEAESGDEEEGDGDDESEE